MLCVLAYFQVAFSVGDFLKRALPWQTVGKCSEPLLLTSMRERREEGVGGRGKPASTGQSPAAHPHEVEGQPLKRTCLGIPSQLSTLHEKKSPAPEDKHG